ncbi:glycosyltransferase [Carboxylicivirga sp. RSCT41]|uniref:glycosyltransferase n=1 Tax=Carboxylicivirga agarovorans TaxID=3417570 RepID=UPI003D325DA2
MLLLYLILLLPLIVYAIKLTGWYIRWTKEVEFTVKGDSKAGVSLIIPFKDEAHNMQQLIGSLKNQTIGTWELILINDHSTDNGSSIAKTLLRNCHIDSRIINAENLGKKAALLQGVKLAKYELIVTTDADCTFHKDWLNTLSTFHSSRNVDLIIAPVTIKRTKGFLSRFQQIDFAALQLSGAAAALQNKAIMCNGANIMCKKELYLKAQLQPQIASGDDMFLLEWMKSQHKKIAFIKSKQVLVQTEPVHTCIGFLQQRARWAAKAPRYRDKHIITTGLMVSSLNLMIFAALTGGIWLPALWAVAGVSIMVKSIWDYLLLQSGSKDLNFNITFFEVLLLQLLYPVYVISVLIFPAFNTIQWKSRTI